MREPGLFWNCVNRKSKANESGLIVETINFFYNCFHFFSFRFFSYLFFSFLFFSFLFFSVLFLLCPLVPGIDLLRKIRLLFLLFKNDAFLFIVSTNFGAFWSFFESGATFFDKVGL